MNESIIRKGSVKDAAAMAEIYNHYVRTSTVIFSNIQLSPAEMEKKIINLGLGTPFPFIILEIEGEICGYAYAHYWHPDPVYSGTWELTAYISPSASGHGHGTAMLIRIIEECRQAGAHTLISCVTEGNVACERMMKKTGFNLRGILPEVGYKFGEYLNDALYQLSL